jgi:hypothetical protein
MYRKLLGGAASMVMVTVAVWLCKEKKLSIILAISFFGCTPSLVILP